jgi:hypothetical protein
MNRAHAKAGKHEDYWANYKDNIKMDPKEIGCEDVKRIFSG